MPAINPIDARVDTLLAQIAAKEEQLRNLQNTAAAERTREQSWAAAGQWGSPEYAEASAAYNAALRAIEVLTRELDALKAELARTQASRDEINAAAAQYVAKDGLDTDVAMAKAAADHERTIVVKRVLTGVGIALLIILLIIAWRYWRKRNK